MQLFGAAYHGTNQNGSPNEIGTSVFSAGGGETVGLEEHAKSVQTGAAADVRRQDWMAQEVKEGRSRDTSKGIWGNCDKVGAKTVVANMP